MDSERAEKLKAFIAAYEDHWKFPGRGDPEDADAWWALIRDKPKAEYRRWVDFVAADYDGKQGPRRNVFRRAWRRLTGAVRRAEEDEAPGRVCADCGDAGYIEACGAHLGDGQYRLPKSWGSTEPLYRFSVPCRCSRGIGPGVHPVRDEVLAWRRDTLSYLAEERGGYPGEVTVEHWVIADLVRESRRAAETARKHSKSPPVSEPAAAAEEQTRGDTRENTAPPVEPPQEPEPVALPAGYKEEDLPF